MHLNRIFFIFIFCGLTAAWAYKIPKPKLEILPQGFRISIPDEPGIQRVAFNINRNRNFKSFTPGDYSVQIRSPENSRWIYENTRNRLENDDTLYYWINVQHNDLIYQRIWEPVPIKDALSINEINDDIDKRSSDGTSEKMTTIGSSTEAYDGTNIGINREISLTKVQNRNVIYKDELLFEDNFYGVFNSSRWQKEVRFPLDLGDAEFVLYDSDDENVNVANGVLTIKPTIWNSGRTGGTNSNRHPLDLGLRCTGKQNRAQECRRQPEGVVHNILPPIKTARINTRNSFSFKYGRIEIRAKMPKGDWLVPLIVLEPQTNNYGTSEYASGQIRIAFTRGNDDLITKDGIRIDGRTLYGGAVFSSESSLREQFFVSLRRDIHFGDDFHTYTLIWTNEKLVMLVDNIEYGYIDGGFAQNINLEQRNIWQSGEYMAPFDQEFYITLGVSAGGHGDFPDDCISHNKRKPWENTSPKAAYKFWKDRNNWMATWTSQALLIDYVRVYAL